MSMWQWIKSFFVRETLEARVAMAGASIRVIRELAEETAEQTDAVMGDINKRQEELKGLYDDVARDHAFARRLLG